MNRRWTPESRVTVTDAGMVIEIELGGIRPADLDPPMVKANRLCIRGRHQQFGPFEVSFDIPSGYSLLNARGNIVKGVLRIEVPLKKNSSPAMPCSMLIYCKACGKHFDIVVAAKGPQNYRCPACGEVQVFDLEAFVNDAVEQGKKMLGKKRGRR